MERCVCILKNESYHINWKWMVKYLYRTSVVFPDDYPVYVGICRQKRITDINKWSGLTSLRPGATITCFIGKKQASLWLLLFVVRQPFWSRVGNFLSADLQFCLLVGDESFSFYHFFLHTPLMCIEYISRLCCNCMIRLD